MDNLNELNFILTRIKEAKNYVPPVFDEGICGLYMNYSMYAPSPKCKSVLENINLDDFKEYPRGGNLIISQSIAATIGVDEKNIIADNGAASILELIFRIVLEEGDILVYPNPGWDYYRSISNIMGIKCQQFDVADHHDRYEYDLAKIQSCISVVNPKIVVITSPNMPTGNLISEDILEKVLMDSPETLFVIDEAYYGYSSTSLDIKRLISQYSNVIFVRTFSKLYGLASERIGYAVSNIRLIELAKKLSPLFGISLTSQLLAKLALEDVEYYQEVAQKTIYEKERLTNQLNSMENYSVYQSHSNFVLIKVHDYDTDDIVKFFYKNGYAIRECGRGYNLKNHLRISIGTAEMTTDLINIFREYDKIKNQNNAKFAKVIEDNDEDFKF